MRRVTGCRWRIMKNRYSLCTSWLLRPRAYTPNIFRRSAIPWGPICLPWPHLSARAGSSSPKPLVLVLKWTRHLCSAIAWIGDRSPLEPQGAQTKAGNVLVFLGGEATHANSSHDRARLGMQHDEPALHRRQVWISHLGDRTALALQ